VHTRTATNCPQAGLKGNNYCRNTDSDETAWCYTTDANTRWAYCDVSQPAASCATNNVHCDSRGVDYRGTAAVTASGKACRAWAAQWPHAHTRTAENYEWPCLSSEGNNYCRKPDGKAGPWCHTTDGDTRWELCAVGAAGACDLTFMSQTLTVADCAGYDLFSLAVQYSHACFCGNNGDNADAYDAVGRAAETDCSAACPGDAAESCGGTWSYSVDRSLVWTSCANGVLDGTESDEGCDGAECGGCGSGKGCKATSDCASEQCEEGVYTSCTNGVANGTKTGVDCGGTTCDARCGVGGDCASNSDCVTGKCDSLTKKCRVLTPFDTCVDSARNYVETDEDNGGPQCNSIGIPCVLTKKCGGDADCACGMCKATAPEQALCISSGDGVKNGDESDTDCGGATCAKSAKSQMCIAEPQYVGLQYVGWFADTSNRAVGPGQITRSDGAFSRGVGGLDGAARSSARGARTLACSGRKSAYAATSCTTTTPSTSTARWWS
jgi:hypothetical protein